MTRTCAHCSGPMDGKRPQATYCSPKCAKAASDKRRRSKPEVKAKRLANDRSKAGVTPDRYRNLDTPESVSAKFGFCDQTPPWDF